MKLLPSMGLCIGLAALSAAAAPEYYPRDLGTLGGTNAFATGLNDHSQVVGRSLNSSGLTEAFAWSNGTMTGLGFLPGGTNSVATAINNRGEITGYSYVSGTNYHAFLGASNVLRDLGTWGGPHSRGYAINDRSEVAGWSYPPPGSNFYFSPYFWKGSGSIGIWPYHNKETAAALGVNTSGYLVGYTVLDIPHSNRTWPIIWWDANTNGSHDTGEMKVLGTLGGQWGIAYAINESGQTVGWASTNWNSMNPRHAFLVTPSNGVWNLPTYSNVDPTNLLMRDLGALESLTNSSEAYALNDRSWIVGMSTTGSGTNQAFLWRNGAMTNLNHLIATGTGWVLTNATGINEYNEIVGSGLYNGQPRAFILQAASALSVLGTNGAPIADSEPPSRAKGSDFGQVALESAVTNVFAIRNLGSSNLTISGWATNGTGAAHFQIAGIPSVIGVGGISNFTVAFAPPAEGTFTASLSIESDAAVPVTNILFAATGVRHPQTIDFTPIGDQWATNEVQLTATASSGLDVAFSIAFGPGVLDATNLTFSGSGEVAVVAAQAGDDYWAPAPPITNVFTVAKVPAFVFLDNLAQTYDGAARAVTATTDPTGLVVEFTYDGLPEPPIHAGTYAVTGTIAEALWEGWTNGMLVVAPADQTIDFPAIGDQWITNVVGLAASASSGLAVEFTIESGPAQITDFTNLTFTGTGPVVVVATQPGDADWNAAPPVSNLFTVSKMPTPVLLHDLDQTYDGTARIATATTEPTGLNVEITYDGLAWAPTNAGTYAVTGTVVEANWEGMATGLLTVAKADQTIDFAPIPDQWTTNAVGLFATAYSGLAVSFSVASGPAQIADFTNLTFTGTGSVAVVASQPGGANWNPAPEVTNEFTVSKMPATIGFENLAQTYNGTARTVIATTDPTGLAVEITYDGLAWAPTNAGTYAVTGTIVEANWEGSATGLLTVAKADQTIDFPPIADPFITNVVVLSATADSGLAVNFQVILGPALITNGNQLAFSSTGQVAVAASQAGEDNWNAAPPVMNAFEVWGLYLLTIESAHGVAEPAVGVYTNLLDTALTNSVTAPEPAGGTQYVCVGWTLVGHDPAAGASNRFEMAVTNHASLVWLWTTNHWLETSAGPHGSVAPSDSWQPAHLPAVLIATPERYYHFDHWTNSASGTNNPFALIMDVPKSARAIFAENLATNSTPEWWLAEHGWTNDFDAAALRDDEPDGFPSWQEYVADTDPTNALSYPRIASIAAEGTNAPVVAWLASTGRAYQVHFSDAFPAGPWATQELSIGVGAWADTNPPLPPWRVYRLAPLRP